MMDKSANIFTMALWLYKCLRCKNTWASPDAAWECPRCKHNQFEVKRDEPKIAKGSHAPNRYA
ncbi:hypothetical protein LCGC14_0485970 [marine sediment metagenome]|uniref:Rubredoxin-like domain-containing protein n=1 Tax=marine sediment metagenome TaxID=412755 RepID=A0A0F9S803_9ZZZZ